MYEFFVGSVFGFIVASIIAEISFRRTIDYKARTGIDLCLGGKFYRIQYNEERKNTK